MRVAPDLPWLWIRHETVKDQRDLIFVHLQSIDVGPATTMLNSAVELEKKKVALRVEGEEVLRVRSEEVRGRRPLGMHSRDAGKKGESSVRTHGENRPVIY